MNNISIITVKSLLYFLLVFPCSMLSQVNDNFEDGNLVEWTQSDIDRWEASEENPLNGIYSLHHAYDNPNPGYDQISIPFGSYDITSNNTTWRFQIKHTYTPSSSNNWACFLFSNTDALQMHPSGTANGYALGVNYTGFDDSIKLWKIAGGAASEVINTGINWENEIGTSSIASFEVKRTTAGEWSIFLNIGGGFDNLIQIGSSVIDTDYTSTGYFGYYHEYSSSQDMKLWIDDVYVGEEILDINPPNITGITKLSSNSIEVNFNENLEEISAETLANYNVDNGIGIPNSAILNPSNHKQVNLTFATNFNNNIQYTLTVNNVEDLNGNACINETSSFYDVQPFDLVINEIMCDVNPAPEALPVFEYIEIYNTSNYDINLSNWTLKIGDNTEKVFPSLVISEGGFAIICKSGAESSFEPFGLPIPILIEDHLTTSGKRLLIKNENGIVIEDLTYSDNWYEDPDKDNGGWSLERIDPVNYCGEEENWTASVDYTGGTPGRINSVFASNPDFSAPEINALEYISSKHIKVIFSEKPEIIQAEEETNYRLNTSIHPISAITDSETTSMVDLYFADNFPIGTNSIQIDNIEDNCGNLMTAYTGSFEYQLIYPTAVEVMSENQLRLHFSEKPEILSAETNLNYLVSNGIGNPDVAIISNADSSIVNLLFSSNFTIEQPYVLTVQNVNDINFNTMNINEIPFVYYIPKAFDIVINEIMADINPEPEALPEARYIELYNTSAYKIDLSDWVFHAEDQSERILPYISLNSHDYLILCESEYDNLFASYGNALPILTSSDLTVSGKTLKLMKPDGTVIEELTYSDEWYDDEDKDNGGWSLERIDSENFCGENDNWTASISNLGGTPGSVNSVTAINQDIISPELIDVHIVSSNSIILEFNENISHFSGSDTLNFSIDNGIDNPLSANIDSENRKLVHLAFLNQFTDNQSYTLTVEHIADNCGNEIQTTAYTFTYYLIYPEKLFVSDQYNLKLVFSETVDFETATDTENYFCDNGTGNPDIVVRGATDSTEVFLHFPNRFPDGEEITLQISNIKDINGNVMNQAEFLFVYYTPKEGDLVINEVLYDPFTDGSDFVEIFNTSSYKIDLSTIQLAVKDDDNSIESLATLSNENFYLNPQTYMAFTSSKTDILKYYMSKEEENIFDVTGFPAYVNETGTVVLLFNDTVILDQFTYKDDLHFKLIDNTEGVSLERVNPYKPTQENSNWHSASEYAGFATPAYQNSQYSEGTPAGEEHVIVTPHVFSPDNDGIDDYADINYKFDNPGFVASIFIFDAKGRIVIQLADNLLLSTEGTVVWDGTDADDKEVSAGTYLVFMKVFDLNGNVDIFKKTVILAKKR